MTDHKDILRTYNSWRRDETGGKTLEDFGITPKMVGEAIDAVLLSAGRYDFLRECDEFFIRYTDGEEIYLVEDPKSLDSVVDVGIANCGGQYV